MTSAPVDHNVRLRLPVYFVYLIGEIAFWAFRIGILVELVRSDISAIGIGVAVMSAPHLVGSIFLSPLADRYDRLNLIIVLHFIMALAVLALLSLDDVNSMATYIIAAVINLINPLLISSKIAFFRSTLSSNNMIAPLRTIANLQWLTFTIGMTFGSIAIVYSGITDIIIFTSISFALCSLIIIGFKYYNIKSKSNDQTTNQDGTGKLVVRNYFETMLIIIFLNLGASIINIYPTVKSATELGINSDALTIMVFFNGVFAFLGASIVKKIYDAFGPLKAIVMGCALVTAALIFMAQDLGLWIAVIASSIMLGFGQIFAVSINTYMISLTSQNHVGQVTGFFQACTIAGVTSNGLIYSLLINKVSFNVIIILCAASTFVALGLALRLFATANKPKALNA